VIKSGFDSQATTQERLVTTTLYSLEDTINRRQEEIVTEGGGKPSWTKKLLLDTQLLCSKIRYIMFILNSVYGIIRLLIN
jgi:phosphoribosyl-AMP cyclohydrolase / phosphoribosyl-ATP pyrophosphohydrolase